jgi:ArsR family transcriptional regulator, arsenate/arsenite/antimonite-responsive transcriptional repressor
MTSPLAGPTASTCCSPTAGLRPDLDADSVAAVAVALASPLRVQIFDVLMRSDAEVCQCELLALFEIAQPSLSHHLGRLMAAGLVRVERRHRWAWYSADRTPLAALADWIR